jgi:head-tail adaptor
VTGVRLTRRMTLEARQSQPDGAGGFIVTWVPVGTIWADVRPGSAREDFTGAAVRPRVACRILVRGAPAGSPSRPRADQRLREGARVFDILTVTEHDPAGRFLEIRAEEGRLP